jgi:uncharacterized membrane protein YphA (DoxX/SURF4 family)
MTSELLNGSIAILLLRTVTGILFFFQGYDKLFNIKIENVYRNLNESLGNGPLPSFLLKPIIALSSYIELVCGLLLFFGLFKEISLHLLAADLIFVAFVFSALKPMWDMQYFFPRMIFVVLLLFTQTMTDFFSVDYLIADLIKK